jgi:hypothetical protein
MIFNPSGYKIEEKEETKEKKNRNYTPRKDQLEELYMVRGLWTRR